jgi:hypothetical protein
VVESGSKGEQENCSLSFSLFGFVKEKGIKQKK